MSFKIRDSYQTKTFNTWDGLKGHMSEEYIPPIYLHRGAYVGHDHRLDARSEKMKTGRWKGKTPDEVFSFARRARISINRDPTAYRNGGVRDFDTRRENREKALARNTRIDINLEEIFPSVSLEDGTETSLICDWIRNDRFYNRGWKTYGFNCNVKNQDDFFDNEWGNPEHVVVGIDAESEEDFLIAYALTTSPSHGWVLRQYQEGHPDPSEFDSDDRAVLAPEFADENGGLARGKINFVLITIKLDIKNRLKEMARKRKKKVSEVVTDSLFCPNCNGESTIGANFCQLCGSKLH